MWFLLVQTDCPLWHSVGGGWETEIQDGRGPPERERGEGRRVSREEKDRLQQGGDIGRPGTRTGPLEAQPCAQEYCHRPGNMWSAQWGGSGMFIPDPIFFHPGSASKVSSIFTQKLLLSSRKYDPGCSSRIRFSTHPGSLIPDPGVKKAPNPGSATLGRRLPLMSGS